MAESYDNRYLSHDKDDRIRPYSEKEFFKGLEPPLGDALQASSGRSTSFVIGEPNVQSMALQASSERCTAFEMGEPNAPSMAVQASSGRSTAYEMGEPSVPSMALQASSGRSTAFEMGEPNVQSVASQASPGRRTAYDIREPNVQSMTLQASFGRSTAYEMREPNVQSMTLQASFGRSTASEMREPSKPGNKGVITERRILTKVQRKNLRRKQRKAMTCANAPNRGIPVRDDRGRKRAHFETLHQIPSVSPPQSTMQKRPREDSPPKYVHPVKYIKVAVVKDGFPLAKLLKEEVDQIQMSILNKLDEMPADENLPRIHGSHLVSSGALMVNCANQETENWLRYSFNANNSIIEGTVLKVMGMEEMPKPIKVAFRTKDIYTKDPKVLVQRLQRLNPLIRFDDWRVLQHLAEPQSTRWIFEVDEATADSIKRAGYSGFTGLDKGVFKILQDSRSKEKGMEAATTEATSSQGQGNCKRKRGIPEEDNWDSYHTELERRNPVYERKYL